MNSPEEQRVARREYWRRYQAGRRAKIAQGPRVLCQCGCGTSIPAMTTRGTASRYVPLHAPRMGPPRRGESHNCVVCGSSFYCYPSYLRGSGHTNEFCSMACYNALKSERLRGIRKSDAHRRKLSETMRGRPSPKCLPQIARGCAQCGRTFVIDRKRPLAVRNAQRFCGTRCWYVFLREHPEAGGNFLGGREPYYGPNWNDQARKARARDGHTCQDCGLEQRRPLLDVHHLIPRRSFHRDHLTANVLENLITVCKSCHTRREGTLRQREAVA